MIAEKRVSDLIVIASELCDIFMTENQALEDNEAGPIKDHLPRKDLLSRAYERGVEALRKMPVEEIKAVDSDLSERLRDVGKKMDELAAINAKLLRVAVAANQSVMEAVANAVRDVTPQAGTYGANGSTAGQASAQRSVAMSLNKTL